MNTLQTIFSLFYAVLYGAIFTISDRWRPFTFAGPNNPEGRKRVISSLMLLVLFPVFYFILCFFSLSYTCKVGFLKLLMTIYLVSPLFAVYVLWAMLVSLKKDNFYSEQEQASPPIAESLLWATDRPLSRIFLYILFLCIVLIIIPIMISSGLLIGLL
jgi:hypothetical protein